MLGQQVLDKVDNSEERFINKYNARLFLMTVASRRRSIVKTLSYLAVVTLILAIVTFVFRGNLYQTSTIAVVFDIFATAAYHLHERLGVG